MRIRRLEIMVLGPILLSLPMMCMHPGDDHHSGGHFSVLHPSYRYSTHQPTAGTIIEQEDVTSERILTDQWEIK